MCRDLVKTFKSHGIRAISDLRNEKIGFKIREHTLAACSLFGGRR